MANYKAVANGNWSNLAIWQDNSTGSFVASTVFPGINDVVYWNNFTVVIDVDVDVLEIRNDSTTGVTQGGTGSVTATRTINADLFHRTGSLLTISAALPNIITIIGNIPGTVATSSTNCINMTGNATLNFFGNITPSPSGSFSNVVGIRMAVGQTLNLTGNITGGNNAANFGATACPIGIRSNTGAIINVVGNLSGGPSGFFNYAILSTGGDTITVTGQVSGGFGSSPGFYNAGIAFEVNAGITNITGNLIGGNNAPALWGLSLSGNNIVNVVGNIQNSINGFSCVLNLPYLFLNSTNMQYEFKKNDLTANILYTPGVNTGHPAEANVRTGVIYGPTNNLTGTCAVPPAGAVSLGVPVDNTTGTAYLSGNDISNAVWDTQTSSLTTIGSIGERLKNTSTVDTTSATVAAYYS